MRTWTTTLLTMALLTGCGAPRAGGGGGDAGPGTDVPIEQRCANVVLDPDAPGGKVALWNQHEVDQARHEVSQARSTDLSLNIRSARDVERPEATVVRTDWNAAQAVDLDDEGGYVAEDLSYSASSIDVLLADDHFPPAPAVAGVTGLRRSLIARWYHPGEWFDQVRFDLDVREISAQPEVLDDGRIAVRLHLPDGASVSDAMASVDDDSRQTQVVDDGAGRLITFAEGAHGDLAVAVTVTPPADVISAETGEGQDPPAPSRTYRRCMNDVDGDPIGDVPDTTPRREVQLLLSFDYVLPT